MKGVEQLSEPVGRLDSGLCGGKGKEGTDDPLSTFLTAVLGHSNQLEFYNRGVVSQSPSFRASIVLSLAACSLSPLPNSFASSFPVGCPCGTVVLHKAFLSSPFLLTLLPKMT